MEQEKRKRGANAILVIPIFAALAAASRIGDVRTVDFLKIFGSGMAVGVVMMRIIQLILDKKKPAA